jgi:uncharacterized protein (DUF58 family)
VTRSATLAPLPREARAQRHGRVGVALGYRGFILLLIGFAWLIPAFVDIRFAGATLAWDACVLAAWALDLWRLPSPAQLTLRRFWLAPPALSVESRVQVTLINDANVEVHARLVDAVPSRLRVSPPDVRLLAPPHQEVEASYTIQPTARGHARVGNIFFRYQSPLHIAERWAVASVAQDVVTCPNLAEAKRYSVYLVRSRQVALEKRSTRMRGTGRAFESLREYRDGDEIRDICWTASARRGKLVTRLYEIERSQTIWVLIDSGRLMRARVAGLSKLDHAVNAALALAQVALNSGDRIGVLAYGRKIAQRVPAARGSAHLRHIIDHLAVVQEDEHEGDHLLAASRVLSDQKSRSLIVWITDLAETAMTPDVVRAAAQLMKRHFVLFIVIGEPDLRALAARRPDRVDQMFETAAAQEVVLRRELLLARLREGGALALETASSGLAPAIVNSYLEIKQRGRL